MVLLSWFLQDSSAEDRLGSFIGTVCNNEFVIFIYSDTSLVFNVTLILGN